MNCTHSLLLVVSGWIPRHVIGAVLVSLPAISVLSHLFCSFHLPLQVNMPVVLRSPETAELSEYNSTAHATSWFTCWLYSGYLSLLLQKPLLIALMVRRAISKLQWFRPRWYLWAKISREEPGGLKLCPRWSEARDPWRLAEPIAGISADRSCRGKTSRRLQESLPVDFGARNVDFSSSPSPACEKIESSHTLQPDSAVLRQGQIQLCIILTLSFQIGANGCFQDVWCFDTNQISIFGRFSTSSFYIRFSLTPHC